MVHVVQSFDATHLRMHVREDDDIFWTAFDIDQEDAVDFLADTLVNLSMWVEMEEEYDEDDEDEVFTDAVKELLEEAVYYWRAPVADNN